MSGMARRALKATYISHSTLVGVAWVRIALFPFFLGILFLLREEIDGWWALLSLTTAFGIYSGLILLLLRPQRHRILLWLGRILDQLMVVSAILLLAVTNLPGTTGSTLMYMILILDMPLVVIHFGVLVGTVVSIAVAGWYVVAYSLAAGPSEGLETMVIRVPIALVVSGLAAWLAYNLRLESAKRDVDIAKREQAEARSQAYLNAIPDLMLRVTGDGEFLDYRDNRAVGTYLPPGDFLGRSVWQVLPTEAAQTLMEHIQLALRTQEMQTLECGLPVSGVVRHCEARIVISGENEVLALVRDITDRKEDEEQIRQLALENEVMAEIGRTVSSSLAIEEAFGPLAESVRKLAPFDRLGVATVDPSRTTMTQRYVLGADVPGWGRGSVTPIGDHTSDPLWTAGIIVVGEDVKAMTKRFPSCTALVDAGLNSFVAAPLVFRDRVIALMSLASFTPDAYTEVDLELARKVGTQIAGSIANAELHSALTKSEQQLRKLNHQLLEAQEDERVRLAGDLHDGPLQKAILLVRDTEGVDDAHRLARDLVAELRGFSSALRPSILDDLGLVPALEWLLEGASMRSAITMRLSLHAVGYEQRFQADIEQALFRVAQEAIGNAVQHSNGTLVEVLLSREDSSLLLEIGDDGKGFAQGGHSPRGVGLAAMRERVAYLDGSFDVRATPGLGTSVICRVPIGMRAL